MRPSEVVVLAVEDLLRSSSLVVVLYDLLVCHAPVVSQYASVCVLTSLRELACGQQQLDEQLVQFLSRVEIIDVARLFCRV